MARRWAITLLLLFALATLALGTGAQAGPAAKDSRPRDAKPAATAPPPARPAVPKVPADAEQRFLAEQAAGYMAVRLAAENPGRKTDAR